MLLLCCRYVEIFWWITSLRMEAWRKRSRHYPECFLSQILYPDLLRANACWSVCWDGLRFPIIWCTLIGTLKGLSGDCSRILLWVVWLPIDKKISKFTNTQCRFLKRTIIDISNHSWGPTARAICCVTIWPAVSCVWDWVYFRCYSLPDHVEHSPIIVISASTWDMVSTYNPSPYVAPLIISNTARILPYYVTSLQQLVKMS